jgi:hypothetical protein
MGDPYLGGTCCWWHLPDPSPTWQFSTRPAVPEYWRCTPALALPYAETAVVPQAES